MLRQWIRQRKVSELSVDPNDPTSRCPVKEDEDSESAASKGSTTKGRWRRPRHFENIIKETLSPTRGASAAKSILAVSAIYFHWAGLGAIKRPEADVQFDAAVGI
jgi:hypothetical protein